MTRWALAGMLAVASCYQPDVPSCVYQCASSSSPCPSGLSCMNGMCAADGDSCDGDAGAGGDAADAGPSFFTLTWEAPLPVTPIINPTRCERRPVLDPTSTYLVFSRPTSDVAGMGACIATGKPELWRWNNGAPSVAGPLAPIEGTSPLVVPTFIADGPTANVSGRFLFVYRTDDGVGTIVLRAVDTTGNLQMITGPTRTLTFPANTEITLDATLRHVVYATNGDLYEGTGDPASGYTGTVIASLSTAETEVTPTMSSDGRVLVFSRSVGGVAQQTDLYVARRANIGDPWGSAMAFPVGMFEINSALGYEYDPFIAPNGDLLFTSTRSDALKRRVFLARHK